MPADLEVAKQRLLEKLGPQYGFYIQLLGKWFRGFISKDEFDKSAKHLIKQNFVAEHNRFWLAFFHHCSSNANAPIQASNFRHFGDLTFNESSRHLDSAEQKNRDIPTSTKVRCLPSKVMTHMKIFVIVWEMGLDSINDQVSIYINLALQHFLKNIITEVICTKTAYRLRDNRFKYAIGVKPMNPYLHNSLRIYTSNLEYDPYQIESTRMNSSVLDTCVYNDALFPNRLYEAQALYEFACSTTSTKSAPGGRRKKAKLSEFHLNEVDLTTRIKKDDSDSEDEVREVKINRDVFRPSFEDDCQEDETTKQIVEVQGSRKVNLHHLLIALSINRTIIPSHSLYSSNLERIFTIYPW